MSAEDRDGMSSKQKKARRKAVHQAMNDLKERIAVLRERQRILQEKGLSETDDMVRRASIGRSVRHRFHERPATASATERWPVSDRAATTCCFSSLLPFLPFRSAKTCARWTR